MGENPENSESEVVIPAWLNELKQQWMTELETKLAPKTSEVEKPKTEAENPLQSTMQQLMGKMDQILTALTPPNKQQPEKDADAPPEQKTAQTRAKLLNFTKRK